MTKRSGKPFGHGRLALLVVGGLAGIGAVEGLRAVGVLPPGAAPTVRHDWTLVLGALAGCASVALWIRHR